MSAFLAAFAAAGTADPGRSTPRRRCLAPDPAGDRGCATRHARRAQQVAYGRRLRADPAFAIVSNGDDGGVRARPRSAVAQPLSAQSRSRARAFQRRRPCTRRWRRMSSCSAPTWASCQTQHSGRPDRRDAAADRRIRCVRRIRQCTTAFGSPPTAAARAADGADRSGRFRHRCAGTGAAPDRRCLRCRPQRTAPADMRAATGQADRNRAAGVRGANRAHG